MRQLLGNQVLIIALLSFLTFSCSKESTPVVPILTPGERLAARIVANTWKLRTITINGQEQPLTTLDLSERHTYRLADNQKSSGTLTITDANRTRDLTWYITEDLTVIIGTGNRRHFILTEVAVEEVFSYVQVIDNHRVKFILEKI